MRTALAVATGAALALALLGGAPLVIAVSRYQRRPPRVPHGSARGSALYAGGRWLDLDDDTHTGEWAHG